MVLGSMSGKVLLRLDDGSLVGRASDLGLDGGDQVVRVSVEQAAQLGRASEKEVARLEAILQRLRQAYPSLQAPVQVHVAAAPPSKRPKLEPVPSYAAAGPTSDVWEPKCHDVLNKLFKFLGTAKPAFYNHVDRKLLPDYYTVITEPLFLVDIEERLRTHQYQEPQEFANDLRHHFSNVKRYNPITDPYRKIGDRAEEYFEQLWAGTGYSQERTRRMTAGMAAPKYDPETFEPPAKPKATRSQQGGATKRPRESGAPGRSMSHEVTSSRPPGRPSEQRLTEISGYLAREDLPDEITQHLLSLLPQEILDGVESGEVELDFGILPDETLQRIDAWLRTLPDPAAHGSAGPLQAGAAHGAQVVSPQPQQQPRPSVQVDSYDDDEDYEAESEESD